MKKTVLAAACLALMMLAAPASANLKTGPKTDPFTDETDYIVALTSKAGEKLDFATRCMNGHIVESRGIPDGSLSSRLKYPYPDLGLGFAYSPPSRPAGSTYKVVFDVRADSGETRRFDFEVSNGNYPLLTAIDHVAFTELLFDSSTIAVRYADWVREYDLTEKPEHFEEAKAACFG